jgi:small-conductance mechanosensitive channel
MLNLSAASTGLRLTLLLMLAGGTAAGQATPDTGRRLGSATVVYAGDSLFTLHGRLGPFGPGERAAAITLRLNELGEALGSGTDTIAVAQVEDRVELLVGEQVLATVMPADAEPTGMSREALAAVWATRIEHSTRTAVAATSGTALLIDAAEAAATTVIFIIVLLLFRGLFRRLDGFLRGPRVRPLRVQRFELLSAARLREALTTLVKAARIFVTLLLIYIYLPLVLSFFPWTAPYSHRIVGYVVTPLGAVWTGFVDFLPNLFFIAVIVVVTQYLLKLVRLVFQALQTGALTIEGFHQDWAATTFTIVRFLVIAFALVVLFPYLPGAGSDAFKGVSLFLGLLVSLGSSGAIGNIVAGVVLTYTNSFRIGDYVRIGETTGDVIERTMLVTRIRTPWNVDITVPNGTVLTSQVINYTTEAAGRGLILHTTVTIGYDSPWRQIHELLISAAHATTNIRPDPAPYVLQTSLDDFYVSYQINAATDKPSAMVFTYAELHQRIQDAFNQAGVEIMSPHYHSLRDGNQITVPAENLAKNYQAPTFRVERVGGNKTARTDKTDKNIDAQLDLTRSQDP